MGHVGKPHFFVSFEIAKILGFSELSIYTEVVILKTFPQHFGFILREIVSSWNVPPFRKRHKRLSFGQSL